MQLHQNTQNLRNSIQLGHTNFVFLDNNARQVTSFTRESRLDLALPSAVFPVKWGQALPGSIFTSTAKKEKHPELAHRPASPSQTSPFTFD
jgi:hypothetical protein